MQVIGFTGTQVGLTKFQIVSLKALLDEQFGFIIHHGDCIGADAQFDGIARTCLGFEWAVIHPANLDNKRANCTIGPRDVLRPTLGPLQRNEKIVEASDWLIACPKEDQMQLRSGTWTTVRYAIKASKPVKVILPDGQIIPWA